MMFTSRALDTVFLDTRLLVLFDEVCRTQSMTRAAENLGVSQPTASIWLGKMRRQLGDPPFVRTSAGVRPTPRADALIEAVRELLASLRVLARIRAVAPGVGLEVVPISAATATLSPTVARRLPTS